MSGCTKIEWYLLWCYRLCYDLCHMNYRTVRNSGERRRTITMLFRRSRRNWTQRWTSCGNRRSVLLDKDWRPLSLPFVTKGKQEMGGFSFYIVFIYVSRFIPFSNMSECVVLVCGIWNPKLESGWGAFFFLQIHVGVNYSIFFIMYMF